MKEGAKEIIISIVALTFFIVLYLLAVLMEGNAERMEGIVWVFKEKKILEVGEVGQFPRMGSEKRPSKVYEITEETGRLRLGERSERITLAEHEVIEIHMARALLKKHQTKFFEIEEREGGVALVPRKVFIILDEKSISDIQVRECHKGG